MKTSLRLVFLALFCVQLSTSQIINYQQISLIVVGDNYSEEDTQIIKENIKTNKQEKLAVRLLTLDKMFYDKTSTLAKKKVLCEEIQNNITKNKKLLRSLGQEIGVLKNKYQKNSTKEKMLSLNKKIVYYNSVREEQNKIKGNFKGCTNNKPKENKNEYKEISDIFHKAYSDTKNAISSNENND